MFIEPKNPVSSVKDIASGVADAIAFFRYVLVRNPAIIDEWRKNHKEFTDEEREEFDKKEREKFNVK